MWTIFATALRSLWSRAGVYVLSAGVLLVGLASIALHLINSGKTAEKLTQATGSLKTAKAMKQIENSIDALAAADARNRLRARWGKP